MSRFCLGLLVLTACPAATDSTDLTTDSGSLANCSGTLAGGVGVGASVTCSTKRPCSGTAYVGIYDGNPSADPELAPVHLAVLPDVDLATQSPVSFELPDVACGSNVLVAFLDIDDNAGDPPRPSMFDLFREPESGRMVEEGAEVILVLNERWRRE